jgi:hypothetical protein
MADNTSQIAGLFMTPEAYQQERQNQFANRAATLAQLDPGALSNFYAMTTGYGAGNALAGALGGQDPQLQQLSAVQGVMKDINPNDPRSLMAAAQKLQSVAPQQAFSLAQRATELNKTLAETHAKLREQVKVEKVGLAKGTEEAVFIDKNTNEQFVIRNGQRIPYTGGIDQTTSKTNVNVPIGQVFDKFFTQKNAEEQAKAWNEYGQSFSTLPATIDKLQEARTLIDQSFTGRNADVKLGAAKLARSLGLPIDVNKASATELTEALTTQFAISELKKNFGSNPAVKDFENQLKVKPNIMQEPETFKKLLDKLVIGLQSEQVAYRQGEAYRQANKGSIDGYNPYMSRADAQTKLLRLTALMDRSKKGTITPDEKAEAVKLQGEMNGR